MNSNIHEAHYTIFCTALFLYPSHIKYSPHHPALTNPQSVFISWRKTPNITPTQNDMKNVSFIAEYMQHSQLNGSKYCLNLSCSVFQDHGPSQILSGFTTPQTWLTTKWQRYCTSNVTHNTSSLRHYHEECSKSILHSPSVPWIQIKKRAKILNIC